MPTEDNMQDFSALLRRMLSCASCTLLLAVSLPIGIAYAAPMTFFGEDVNMTDPCPNDTDTPLRPATLPMSRAAHDQFVSNLSGVQTETFERYPPESSPTNLLFGSVTATLSGSLVTKSVPTGTLDGTYPTSGNQFLLQFGAAGTFQVTFSLPQTAFGFFATDVGDGGAQLIVQFEDTFGTVRSYNVPHSTSVPFACPNISGSALFYGVIDSSFPFVKVIFTNTFSSFDGFGFDDMSIGSTGPCSPLPGPASDLFLEAPNAGSELHFTWTNAPDADDYVVFADQSPTGTFEQVVGTSSTGGVGLTIPMPSGNWYYLVAGSNAACGVGPKR